MIPLRYSARLGELWRYVRPLRWRLTASLVGLAFGTAASLLYPWLLREMVNRINGPEGSFIGIDELCAVLAGVFILSSLVGYAHQRELRVLGFRFRNTLRRSVFRALLSRSLENIRDARVGELSARTIEDTGRLQNLFSGIVAPIVQNVLFVGGCLVLMSLLSPIATIIVLVLVALPVPAMLALRIRIRELSSRSLGEQARANALFTEALVAFREVKSFVREKTEVGRYGRILSRALSTETELAALQLRVDQAIYLLFSLSLTGIFYAGLKGVLIPSWGTGDVIAFFFYSYTMTMALLSIGRTYLAAQETASSWMRIARLLETEPESAPRLGIQDPVTGGVEFSSVSFSYDRSLPVLNGVSFFLAPGEWLLVTGTSGSGKSTLAGLLMGMMPPDSGAIRIDGIDLADRDPASYRKHLGYVGQDPMLFHGTIRENLLLGDPHAPDELLSEVMRIVCLDDLLDALPRGLDTHVGERGYTLSNGQKARVAIARALVSDPPILILDEANSSIEVDLERRLWSNLVEARGSRTTIIFSHRTEHIPSVCSAARLCEGILLPVRKEATT